MTTKTTALALLFAFPALALAAAPDADESAPSKPKMLPDYLADLGDDDSTPRLFAARYIRGEIQRATWVYTHSEAGSIANLDARSLLTEIDARAPEACTAALLFDNTAALCAEILADLERVDLLPRVLAAAEKSSNKATTRRFEAAIRRLESVVPTTPAPVEAPSAVTTPAPVEAPSAVTTPAPVEAPSAATTPAPVEAPAPAPIP